MIELKDVTTHTVEGEGALADYSRIINNGDFCVIGKVEGLNVINALIGFHPVESGIVSFDGMPLTARSVSFLRKMIAYVPSPEGFENVEDVAKKQLEMVNEAVGSDSAILLAVDPTSHQDELQSVNIMNVLRQHTANGRIVVVASDKECM